MRRASRCPATNARSPGCPCSSRLWSCRSHPAGACGHLDQSAVGVELLELEGRCSLVSIADEPGDHARCLGSGRWCSNDLNEEFIVAILDEQPSPTADVHDAVAATPRHRSVRAVGEPRSLDEDLTKVIDVVKIVEVEIIGIERARVNRGPIKRVVHFPPCWVYFCNYLR